jgi:hypothetical protein
LKPLKKYAGTEELYLLAGHLHTEGQVMQPGDFLRAEAGTYHHEVFSPDGCTALLIVGPAGTEEKKES